MDREACNAAVHGIAKSAAQLSNWTELIFLHWYACVQLSRINWAKMHESLSGLYFLLHWFVYYDSITSLFLFLQFSKNKISIYILPLFLLKIYFGYSKPFCIYLYFRISLPIFHNKNKSLMKTNWDSTLSIRKIDI